MVEDYGNDLVLEVTCASKVQVVFFRLGIARAFRILPMFTINPNKPVSSELNMKTICDKL